MEYRILRSRRKTLSLEITRNAEILVRAPLRTSDAVIAAFVRRQEKWIETHLQKQKARLAAHPAPTEAEAEVLRQRAKAELPPLVAYYASRMGVTPTGITVTSAVTRFGSCSPKNRLCFSLRLMQYPQEAIEYVVVHELAHILQKNHSAAFYAEVAKILPDWKARQALLK